MLKKSCVQAYFLQNLIYTVGMKQIMIYNFLCSAPFMYLDTFAMLKMLLQYTKMYPCFYFKESGLLVIAK